jgi:hypothetical protein
MKGRGSSVQRPTGIGARLVLVILGAVMFCLMAPLYASAAVAVIKTTGPVISLSCTPCHANIADNKIPNIKFSHAAHILYECSACHTKFPHQPEGTTIPGMKECWSCHALIHGPQGVMASGDCGIKCHTTTAPRRPKFHTPDWKGKPHVAPGVAELQTTCMRCHDKPWCEDCHLKSNIYWVPAKPYIYDPGPGCMDACHGGDLPRLKGPVTGIEASAHRDTRCIDCHPDFKYEPETKDATNLWYINSGIACRACHLTMKQTPAKLESVKVYDTSIHAKAIANKNYKSATCASCHGGHDIERLKTPAAKRNIRLAGEKMCSACHQSGWDSYNDYWHGAAYKSEALDAPTCWDCHDGKHGTLQVKDPKSQASPERLGMTCGGKGLTGIDGEPLQCHEGSTSDFAAWGKPLIHGLAEARADNPLVKFRSSVFGG